jgi:DNA-binding MarR family transcriptional regulator
MRIIRDMATRSQPLRTLHTDAARALAADLGWQARQAARLVTAELDRALAVAGLSSAQFGLMCLIASAPDDTLGALAQRAGLNQSTMSRNIDLLARAGWVEVATVAQDRRQRQVWLTEAGATLLAGAMPAWRAAQRALKSKLGARCANGFYEAGTRLASAAGE